MNGIIYDRDCSTGYRCEYYSSSQGSQNEYQRQPRLLNRAARECGCYVGKETSQTVVLQAVTAVQCRTNWIEEFDCGHYHFRHREQGAGRRTVNSNQIRTQPSAKRSSAVPFSHPNILKKPISPPKRPFHHHCAASRSPLDRHNDH